MCSSWTESEIVMEMMIESVKVIVMLKMIGNVVENKMNMRR